MSLKGKTALVTGASRGIGEAIARRFAAEGARVALAARSVEACRAIAADLERSGGEAIAVACDVTKADSSNSAVEEVRARWPVIDILVNNAGASGLTPLDGGPEVDERWDGVIASSLTSAFRVTRQALPAIPDGGRILLLSSVLGRFGVPGYAAYVAAKHGIVGLTRTMALELAPRRITVNAICPGWVETEMARKGFERIASARGVSVDEARALCARMAPLNRVLDPAEIAGLAFYIASDEARNLTGQAIVLDGGQVMP